MVVCFVFSVVNLNDCEVEHRMNQLHSNPDEIKFGLESIKIFNEEAIFAVSLTD